MVEMNSIINFLNSFAPPCLAEDYDNVGLLVGDKNKEVCRVLIALDVDEYVLEDADKKSCDLVITHHPLIFKPLKRIDTEDSVSRSIIKLIKNDISLISVHTNFDSVKSGLCDMFLDKIADVSTRAAIDGDEYNGAGRIGDLKNESTFEEIIKRVKKEFEIDKSSVFISPQDIRNFQLGKAAIRAGIETLLDKANISAHELKRLYIAGALGKNADIENCKKIGLIPKIEKEKIILLSNAALRGASMILEDRENIKITEEIAKKGECIELSLCEEFTKKYIEYMSF